MPPRSSIKINEQSKKRGSSLSKLKVQSTQSEVRFKLDEEQKPAKPITKVPHSATEIDSFPKSMPTEPLREFKDDVDQSRHPSYTKFKLPYEVVCRLRYHKAVKDYDRQFKRELEKLETMQTSAYEALRFNRIFSITTLWPPLHTRKEIEYVLRNFYTMPPKQQARLNYLLNEDQI